MGLVAKGLHSFIHIIAKFQDTCDRNLVMTWGFQELLLSRVDLEVHGSGCEIKYQVFMI
jgi:hypothetical protein